MKRINKKIKQTGLSLMICLTAFFYSSVAFARGGGYTGVYDLAKIGDLSLSDQMLLYTLGLMLLAAIIVLVACIYVFRVITLLFKTKEELVIEESGGTDLWVNIRKRFITGDLVSVEKEKDIMLDHAYDGISELNNFMPPWLKYVFYICIVWSIGYVAYYLVFNLGMNPEQEYQYELAVAEKKAEARKLLASAGITEDNAEFIQDAVVLAKAEKLYVDNCAACHRADGGGSVGPNLTDDYWIHGGSVKDIFKIIKYGVAEKGMIPWKDKLTPEEMQGISSYILTLQGTNPENPKAPQGEKF